MRVLLYSAVLYLLGIAVVLYLRPKLMFKDDGTWKEFGAANADSTYFPFWLFCVVWAVIAHGVVRMLYSPETPLSAMPSLTASTAPAAHVPAEATEEAKPGYYKLDSSLMKRKGVPRYIYVGSEKPSDLEE